MRGLDFGEFGSTIPVAEFASRVADVRDASRSDEMARLQRKSLSAPDETRSFPNGKLEIFEDRKSVV